MKPELGGSLKYGPLTCLRGRAELRRVRKAPAARDCLMAINPEKANQIATDGDASKAAIR